MPWARLGIVGAAVLLALQVVMLAGVDLGHPHSLVTTNTLVSSRPTRHPRLPTRRVDRP